MRFLHISDLHLGKSVCGVSMQANGDQQYWLDRFLSLCDETKPDAVLIAGDVYDRSLPSGEAVQLFSSFLTKLSEKNLTVLLVAGNHDSPERISYAADLLTRSRIYAAGTLTPKLPHIVLNDEYGPVHFYLMPYVFPERVHALLKDDTITDYDSAVRALLAAQDIDPAQRNVLVAHQNVVTPGHTGILGGSETMIGGVGEVKADAFDAFDYVALGHIHAAYPVGRDSIRYAGSPLCYHFDETKQDRKGPLLVTLGPKGTAPVIEKKLIAPLHPMRIVEGTYLEVRRDLSDAAHTGEYLSAVITDQRVSPELYNDLSTIAKNHDSVLMKTFSTYRDFGDVEKDVTHEEVTSHTLEELFSLFYAARSGGQEPSDKEWKLMQKAGEIVRNAEDLPTDADADALLSYAEDL